EAIRAGSGVHTGYGVESNGGVQFIHRLKEGNEFFGVKRPVSDYPGNDNADQTELLNSAPSFFGSQQRVLNRYQSHTVQSLGRSRALLSDVVIVGTADGGRQFLVFQIENPHQTPRVDDLKLNFQLVPMVEPSLVILRPRRLRFDQGV